MMDKQADRKGFSLVELEVAFVVFAIAMAGLCPLVVMQSKHLKRIENRFSQSQVYYLRPSSDKWARKLGACAMVLTSDPGAPPADAITVIDNGDAGFSLIGDDWEATNSPDSFLGDDELADAGDGTQIARWQFTGLKPGWYDVRATWLPDAELAEDAPFEVFDGTTSVATLAVNQQAAPTGELYADKPWESLGIVPISGNVLNVELTNAASGKVAADCVRLIRVENEVSITAVEKALNSEDVTAHVTVTVRVPQ